MDTEAADRLRQRVLLCVPPNLPAFAALLGLLTIDITEDIATAAVSLGALGRMRINPRFVALHCQTEQALRMVVLHELMHVLLGHTRMASRVTATDNLVFDAIINAHLCQVFADAEHTALFRQLYAADEAPLGLLRPPDGWPQAPQWQLTGAFGQIHRRLYTDCGVTSAELYELVRQQWPEQDHWAQLEELVKRLLGNHSDIDPNDAQQNQALRRPSGELMRAIKAIVARWPAEQIVGGRDQGGQIQTVTVEPPPRNQQVIQVLRRAMYRAADKLAEIGARLPHLTSGEGLLASRTGRDNRAEALASIGEEPLQFVGQVAQWSSERHSQVHVYLDVSGSMSRELGLIYGALAPLLHLIHPRIHLFSVGLQHISPQQLRNGVVRTNGGTEIVAVVEHMVAHRVLRAVVITDGEVGPVPNVAAKTLRARRARIQCVVSAEGNPSFAAALAGQVHRLPR